MSPPSTRLVFLRRILPIAYPFLLPSTGISSRVVGGVMTPPYAFVVFSLTEKNIFPALTI